MATTLSDTAAPVATGVPAARRFFFIVLLLLSGFCGISYEVLYARILTNFIGDQFAVSASILLTFMLGIGCGTLYAHRFWRFLWLIEGAIGVFGAALALSSARLEGLYYSMGAFSSGLGGAMLVCFVLLMLPAFLVGCSLPLFAGYLSRLRREGGFARAYMVYNFGAALTVLFIEFVLLRQVGVRNTVLVMSALNGVVAALLYVGFPELRTIPETPSKELPIPHHHLLALGIASVASAVFQLLMIKLAECFIGPFRETFAIVLTLILLGIAIGSAFARRWRLDFRRLLLMSLVGLAWLLGGYDWVTSWYAGLKPSVMENYFAAILLRTGALALLMGLPAIAFGATIPALLVQIGNVSRDSGRLLCISSLANAFGFLLMAFVLHRYLDYGLLIIVIAVLAGLSLLVYLRFRGREAWAVTGLLGLVLFLHWTRWDEHNLYLSADAYESREHLNHYKRSLDHPEPFKGHQDVFSLNRMGNEVHFFINGYISMNLESPPERLVAAFPALFTPRTNKALVLGLGSGITAGTAALLFDRVDAVEINPAVMQNIHRMGAYNFDIANNRKVNFILDDGLHFINVSQETYPLIINTVTSPRYFSSSKLYTRDFLEKVRARLDADGIYVTWIDGRIGQRGLDIILKTIGQSFPECWLGGLRSSYFLLLCSQQPLQFHQPSLVINNPSLKSYLKTNGLNAEWLPYALLSTHPRDLITDATVPINTRDRPVLEFQMALLDEQLPEDFSSRIEEQMDLAEIANALKPVVEFNAVDFVIFSDRLLQQSPLTDRRRALASRDAEDFGPKYRAAKLEFYATFAAAGHLAEAHHLYAVELLAARRFQETIAQEQKALALDPNWNDAHTCLGLAYERLGQLQPALSNYAQELEIDEEDAEAHFGMGSTYYKMGKYEQALKHLKRAKAGEAIGAVDFYLNKVLEELKKKKQGKPDTGAGAGWKP